jgi:hypothetical protein
MKIGVRIDTSHFACDLNRKWRWIKGCNTSNAARGCSESVPEFLTTVAERRHAANAADDNAIGPAAEIVEWHVQNHTTQRANAAAHSCR